MDVGRWGFRSYREHLAELFPGRTVRKLCLSAGFTCPNIDGRSGRGGCSYCDNAAFAPRTHGVGGLQAQWDRGRRHLRRRYRQVDAFIAYFQSFSNTYAPVDGLRRLYDALPGSLPECCGLSISTRPDCVPDEVLDYLADKARSCYLCLELGLQSAEDSVLRRCNRGHDVATFVDAVERAARRGLELCAHVMLGLPGESGDAPERLGRLLAALPIAAVKLHNFHIVRHTAFARALAAGRCNAPSRAAYLDGVVRLLGQLRADQCVQRVVADAPDRLLLSEAWCHDKQGFLRDLDAALATARRPRVDERILPLL